MATWNDDTLALAWKIIHYQDKLTAAFGLAVHRGIAQEKYIVLVRLLPVIRADAKMLETKCRELLDLNPRRGKKGRPPKWFEITEDILYFSLKVQRAIDKIEADDIPSNKFKVIRSRFDSCQITCNLTQLRLLNSLPENANNGQSYVVETVTDLIEILEMGKSIDTPMGTRWRRT
jgi:hypothetical protein